MDVEGLTQDLVAAQVEDYECDCVDDMQLMREQLAEEIMQRSHVYRLLHRLYRWPFSQEELNGIDVDELGEMSRIDGSALMAAGFNDMYRYLRRSHTGIREDLNVDFTRSFMGGATYKGLCCQPYASLFMGNAGEIMGEPRNQARAAYKAQRIKLAEGIDLPEDHLSFECEFMAIMGERAANALIEGRDADAACALECQEKFFTEQMLLWTERFFDLCAELVRTRFYRGVVKMTRGFFENELISLTQEQESLRELMAA